MFRTLATLVCLFGMAGCDVLTYPEPQVRIVGVQIEEIDLNAANGQETTGRDLYFEVQNALGRVYLSSTVWHDVTDEHLPIRYNEPGTGIGDLGQDLYLNVIDPASTAKGVAWLASAPVFSLAEARETRATTLQVVDETEGFRATLTLEWLD